MRYCTFTKNKKVFGFFAVLLIVSVIAGVVVYATLGKNAAKVGKEVASAGRRAARKTKTKPNQTPQNAKGQGSLGPHSAQDHFRIACLQNSAKLLPGITDDL